jgi:hypothetical protein
MEFMKQENFTRCGLCGKYMITGQKAYEKCIMITPETVGTGTVYYVKMHVTNIEIVLFFLLTIEMS